MRVLLLFSMFCWLVVFEVLEDRLLIVLKKFDYILVILVVVLENIVLMWLVIVDSCFRCVSLLLLLSSCDIVSWLVMCWMLVMWVLLLILL